MAKLRVWKLGNLEYGLYPTQESVNKLAEMLLNTPDGVTADLIWGPDLEVFELDNEKVIQHIVHGPEVSLSQEGNVIRISSNRNMEEAHIRLDENEVEFKLSPEYIEDPNEPFNDCR